MLAPVLEGNSKSHNRALLNSEGSRNGREVSRARLRRSSVVGRQLSVVRRQWSVVRDQFSRCSGLVASTLLSFRFLPFRRLRL
jgi:hypothetical protein